jgi:hypothetical protein
MFAQYFLLNPIVFDQIKLFFFLLREWYLAASLSRLPFSRVNMEFMLKISVLVSKLVFFAILPE